MEQGSYLMQLGLSLVRKGIWQLYLVYSLLEWGFCVVELVLCQLASSYCLLQLWLMTHKYRGSIIVLSISKSVELNEEQKEMTSGF